MPHPLGCVVMDDFSISTFGHHSKVSFFCADFRSYHVFAIGQLLHDPTGRFMRKSGVFALFNVSRARISMWTGGVAGVQRQFLY